MAPLLPTVEKEPVKQHFRRLQGSLTQEDWASFKRYALAMPLLHRSYFMQLFLLYLDTGQVGQIFVLM